MKTSIDPSSAFVLRCRVFFFLCLLAHSSGFLSHSWVFCCHCISKLSDNCVTAVAHWWIHVEALLRRSLLQHNGSGLMVVDHFGYTVIQG